MMVRTSPMIRRFTQHSGPLSYAFRGRRPWSTFSVNQTSLTIDALNSSFPFVWLRDSCQSEGCVHPSTRQKLHRTSDVPLDVRPVSDGVRISPDGKVSIRWADGHASVFDSAFLKRYSSSEGLSKFHKDVTSKSWDASTISSSPQLFTEYSALRSKKGLLDAITQLTQYGLLFVRGVPNEATSNETCELPTLASVFGPIRETFYGMTWDVKNVSNSKNIAYTNLYLGLHMDLLYFQHPPRYQILHCLRNRVRGGESLFVDAQRVAQVLRKTNASDFEVLATTPVSFHYINDGHHLHYEHPTIQLGGTLSTPFAERPISHINFSPPFQAPLPLYSTPANFYPAYKNFANLLDKPEFEYKYLLKEGDAVLFDNRRVLHARLSFEDIDGEEGETNRWLKGCYLEADAILDTARVLRARLAM